MTPKSAAILCCLTLVGCAPPAEQAPVPQPPAAEQLPVAEQAPSTDQWLGQWTGPEGTFLRIEGAKGNYDLTIQNLDGPRQFTGSAAGDHVQFERDGVQEVIRASNGQETGMKWLADKKDCLTVRPGEGYCRD